MEGTGQKQEQAQKNEEQQKPAEEQATRANANLLLDLKLIRTGFSPTPDKNLDLDGYMNAYTEMNKFLSALGVIFNMVTDEINSKVAILRQHLQSSEGQQYATLGSMLRYEQGQAEGGVPGDREGRPSGARTLLRLHRALEFVMQFMTLIVRPKDGFFGGQVSSLYSATLGKHHGWLLRATISAALYTLPSHASIIQTMMKSKTEMPDSVREDMDHAVTAMKAAYDLTQDMYRQYGYLDLP